MSAKMKGPAIKKQNLGQDLHFPRGVYAMILKLQSPKKLPILTKITAFYIHMQKKYDHNIVLFEKRKYLHRKMS
jgi:hypothetical protein